MRHVLLQAWVASILAAPMGALAQPSRFLKLTLK
jgi:hypothetical protein